MPDNAFDLVFTRREAQSRVLSMHGGTLSIVEVLDAPAQPASVAISAQAAGSATVTAVVRAQVRAAVTAAAQGASSMVARTRELARITAAAQGASNMSAHTRELARMIAAAQGASSMGPRVRSVTRMSAQAASTSSMAVEVRILGAPISLSAQMAGTSSMIAAARVKARVLVAMAAASSATSRLRLMSRVASVGAGTSILAARTRARARVAAGANGSSTMVAVSAVSAAFDPASLFASGEAGLFYDISDLSSMNTEPDQSGTAPAIGDAVRFIEDKSGNGNHATSNSLAASPKLQQDANSKYYLEFDGNDDFFDTGILVDADNDSFCLGVSIDSGASSNANFFGAAGSDYLNRFYAVKWLADLDYWLLGTVGEPEDSVEGSTGVKGNGPYVLSGVYQNSNTVEAWENGVSQGTASPTEAPTTNTSLHLGNYHVNDATPSSFLNGGIYGVVFQPGEAWTAAQREGVEEFVAGKSGVTL